MVAGQFQTGRSTVSTEVLLALGWAGEWFSTPHPPPPASCSHSRVARVGGVGRHRCIYSGLRAGCWGCFRLREELS